MTREESFVVEGSLARQLHAKQKRLLRSIGWLRYGEEAVAGGNGYGGSMHFSL